jgi:S-DNA-T family DNA segregation ATPase FtsK/SpoIIIE
VKFPARVLKPAKLAGTGLLLSIASLSAFGNGGVSTIGLSAFAGLVVAKSIAHWRVKTAWSAFLSLSNEVWLLLVTLGVALPLVRAFGFQFIASVSPALSGFMEAQYGWLALATVGSWVGVGTLAAVKVSFGAGRQTALKAELVPALAKIFGGTELEWIDHSSLRRERDGTIEAFPVPAGTGSQWELVPSRIEIELPSYALDPVSTPQRITLRPLADVDGEAHRREALSDSENRVSGVERRPDTRYRTDHQVWILSPGILSSQNAGLVDAQAQTTGLSLVEWLPLYRRAVIARLPEKLRALRDRIAGLQNIAPWEIEIDTRLHADGDIGEVTFFRYPPEIDAAKRIEDYLTAVQALVAIPGAYWRTTDDIPSGTMLFERIADPLAQVQPYPWGTAASYNSVPFAVGVDGNVICLGLLESNILVGGSPGGGKSGGLTCLLTGISQLTNVAIVGLDPKRVEQSQWSPRFTRVSKSNEYTSQLLEALLTEMNDRYQWLDSRGLKKLEPDDFGSRPMIVLVIDELADIVAMGTTKEEKEGDAQRASMIQRLVSLGRAAAIVTISATQKPAGETVPTKLRDLIQQRVAYATSTVEQTDTILGSGMGRGTKGGLAHEIPADARGVCYVLNESSRLPERARTFWVPDSAIQEIAKRTAHLRVELPWLPQPEHSADGTPTEANLTEPNNDSGAVDGPAIGELRAITSVADAELQPAPPISDRLWITTYGAPLA